MQGVAYGSLQKHAITQKVNREFRNSLKSAWEQNIVKNKSFFGCVQYLKCFLSDCNCKYAMLTGALLYDIYPEGYRTSNDIDLLVLPEDVTQIGDILRDAGFEQGKIINDQFFPASRREIIESKMMRGETVPYIKHMELPGIKYLEVDINFSLGFGGGNDEIERKMLNAVSLKRTDHCEIFTLKDIDFFIHLCAHLYKEASTLPWVEMKRDMSLYKYCDIYTLISDMNENDTKYLFERAKELGLEKICGFAILETAAIFDINNKMALDISEDILSDDLDFIHTVISPKDKKVYVYTNKDVFNRLFLDNRLSELEEV